MCYNVSYLAQRRWVEAYYKHASDEELRELEAHYRQIREAYGPHYHVSGFAHPKLPVFTNLKPGIPQMFTWGLVPFWVKTKNDLKKIWNQTLNARGETIFEKPAFRAAAKSRRCLIMVDSFFEHHHYNGKTYPFNIALESGAPMTLAGLWEEWVDKETGEIIPTVSIVTCKANSVMEKIHNNPKVKEGRMPVILPRELQESWLREINTEADRKELEKLIIPFREELLTYRTVAPLLGKNASPNTVEALEEVTYPELSGLFQQ